jgi:hypothetical protein
LLREFLAINKIKTYKCCIRKLTEKLSDAQEAEYLESHGRLIKSLNGNVASHIVHLNQIKSNIDGMIVFKSKRVVNNMFRLLNIAIRTATAFDQEERNLSPLALKLS